VQKAFIVLLLVSLLDAALAADNEPEAEEIKYWFGDMTTPLLNHQMELMDQLMQRNASDYPRYKIVYSDRDMTPERWRREAKKGKNIHIHFSSGWKNHDKLPNVHIVSRPYLKNLLGLRQCIARKSALPLLKPLNSFADLKDIRVGLVQGWPDIQPYEQQGIRVVETQTYEAMFSMLNRGRFECLPLSILEIDQALEDQHAKYPELAVAPHLYFYYPISVYFGITEAQPQLIERFERATEGMFADGSIDRLFNKHFSKPVDAFRHDEGATVVILDNPLLEPAHNARVIEAFRQSFADNPKIKFIASEN